MAAVPADSPNDPGGLVEPTKSPGRARHVASTAGDGEGHTDGALGHRGVALSFAFMVLATIYACGQVSGRTIRNRYTQRAPWMDCVRGETLPFAQHWMGHQTFARYGVSGTPISERTRRRSVHYVYPGATVADCGRAGGCSGD